MWLFTVTLESFKETINYEKLSEIQQLVARD